MFLVESLSTAILYTGDIRAEPWWVNSICQNPVMVPYASGIKRLNKLYLDTTFASLGGRYRDFPEKAVGLRELILEVLKYPEDTVFHINSWTFGYEAVWTALASVLRSQVLNNHKLSFSLLTLVIGSCRRIQVWSVQSFSCFH